MSKDAFGDRQGALRREVIFCEQRAELVARLKRAFQMPARLRKCLLLQAHHAGHPGRVWQIACGFQLGQCRILITIVERTQPVYEGLFLGWGHEPSEKPEGQLVPRLGGGTRALTVLDGVEEARARQPECGSVPPGADGVFGTARSE